MKWGRDMFGATRTKPSGFKKQALRIAIGVFLVPIAAICDTSRAASDQYRVAMARYAFQMLNAMPIFDNKLINVGDVVQIENEQVPRSASRCFENLRTDSGPPKFDYIGVSLDASLNVSGSAELKRAIKADASLRQALSNRSVLFIDNMRRVSPNPDQLELSASKISRKTECDYVRKVMQTGKLGTEVIASIVFRAEVSGGFRYKSEDSAEANAAADEIVRQFGDGDVAVRHEQSGSGIHLTGSQWGTIAIQPMYLNRRKMAQVFVLLRDSPGSIAEYERKINEYLSTDSPGMLREISWWFRGMFEKIGLRFDDIEALKRDLYRSIDAEPVGPDDIKKVPQEHWDAIGVAAAGALIKRAN